MLDFPLIGRWSETNLFTSWIESSRPILPEVEGLIDRAWTHAAQRPGVHLFNGPMCRLEAFDAAGTRLHLTLAPTDYKTFVGTNLSNPALADRFGPTILANGVGLSTAVLSGDDHVLLGRRNERVNYYPSRIHPFSGSLEPAERVDVFAGVRRELREELALEAGDIASINCLGIAVDRSIRQPELIFAAQTRLSLEPLRGRLDAAEHIGVWTATITDQTLLPTIPATFTPIGIAALLLLGRERFGVEWFDAQRRKLGC